MTSPDPLVALVADIGGTNTRVALADGPLVRSGSVKRYKNAEHRDLAHVLSRFLEECGSPEVDAACVAVAGPVRDGVGQLTNHDWTFDRDTLGRATGAQILAILNDLQAQGHALPHLDPANVTRICQGQPASEHAAQMVMGVGTGFNAASVFRTELGVFVPPSESGHVSLPVHDQDDLKIARFIEDEHGFAAVEEVLSGRGLEMLYRVHAHAADSDARPKAAEIMDACQSHADPVAERAVADFARFMGRVAGDLALIMLPFGGLYLVGGVSRALAPYLQRFGFAEAFRDKGRFSGFLDQFPVHVVEDDYAALTGAASHLIDLARRRD